MEITKEAIACDLVNGFHFYYYDKDWQIPVATEQRCFELFFQHQNIPNHYFAFPWASLIDKKLTNTEILNHFRIPDKSCFTVIQHFLFRQYLKQLKEIGITHIFTPHKAISDDELETQYGIKISAFSLYPVQHLDGDVFPILDRPYLTSFIGLYRNDYISTVRQEIFNRFSAFPDCNIVRRSAWHYDEMVYGQTKTTNQCYEEEFKTVLRHSKFSLCPSGVGPNSIRIWESMSFGSIPVVLADTLVLPEIPSIDWSQVFVLWKENEIGDLYEHLQKWQTNEELLNRLSKINVELFHTYFSKDKLINTILAHYDAPII